MEIAICVLDSHHFEPTNILQWCVASLNTNTNHGLWQRWHTRPTSGSSPQQSQWESRKSRCTRLIQVSSREDFPSAKDKWKEEDKREECEAEGCVHVSEEWMCICCLAVCARREDEPPEEYWGRIANQLNKEIGVSVNTVKRIFKECQDGNAVAAHKQKEGSGAKRKLNKDNPGLLAAAMALNVGAPPNLAAETCNTVNIGKDLKDGDGEPLTVCAAGTLW